MSQSLRGNFANYYSVAIFGLNIIVVQDLDTRFSFDFSKFISFISKIKPTPSISFDGKILPSTSFDGKIINLSDLFSSAVTEPTIILTRGSCAMVHCDLECLLHYLLHNCHYIVVPSFMLIIFGLMRYCAGLKEKLMDFIDSVTEPNLKEGTLDTSQENNINADSTNYSVIDDIVKDKVGYRDKSNYLDCIVTNTDYIVYICPVLEDNIIRLGNLMLNINREMDNAQATIRTMNEYISSNNLIIIWEDDTIGLDVEQGTDDIWIQQQLDVVEGYRDSILKSIDIIFDLHETASLLEPTITL